jgi:hypothetical protein
MIVLTPPFGRDCPLVLVANTALLLDADSAVNTPEFAAVPPMAGGDDHIVVLHVNPVFVVYCKRLAEVLQLGMLNADGEALALVGLATTVFAAIADKPEIITFPHVGAVDAPVEMIACPLDELVGLSS